MPQRTATRHRLVDSATELFWSKGYHATGVKEILHQAGATSGSLYHFFPTKEDLLLAVLEEHKSTLQERILQPAFAQTDDPIERIFAILAFYQVHLQRTECSLGCPIGNAAAELSDTHPEARRKVSELFAAWTAGVKECLDEAADRFPEDIDTQQLAELVLTVMEGGILQARAQRQLGPFEASVRHLRRYLEMLQRERTA